MDHAQFQQLMRDHGFTNTGDAIRSFNFVSEFLRQESKSAGGNGSTGFTRHISESVRQIEKMAAANPAEHDLFVLVVEDVSDPAASFILTFLVHSTVEETSKLLAAAKADYEARFPDEEFTWGNICRDFKDTDWSRHGLLPPDRRYSCQFVEYGGDTLD